MLKNVAVEHTCLVIVRGFTSCVEKMTSAFGRTALQTHYTVSSHEMWTSKEEALNWDTA